MSLYVLEGLRPWVIQRVSAVYMALFIIYAAWCYFTADVIGYQPWKSWLYHPFNTSVVGIFIIAVLFHAWIGMRDVVLDYVHNIMLRIFVLGILFGVLIGSALWVFRILLLSVVS
ncbi:MAG: succinate dehydrogenase, hydrophobic membrane anchor protein [Gammaproteobacteria bacterium]|jgi:succinate dehydrogenase / fumarate reductase membrane anchor subunit|nr:succinate dehydrogenase, hydrophobic membrane anchor protein [Gammaproteobacteria bacterium]